VLLLLLLLLHLLGRACAMPVHARVAFQFLLPDRSSTTHTHTHACAQTQAVEALGTGEILLNCIDNDGAKQVGGRAWCCPLAMC